EEQLIFSLFNTNEQSQPTFSDATEAIALVELLKTQHTQMRLMSIALSTGHTDQLEAFGILLRDHTRLEERRLFPLISEIFTTEALDIIEKQTTIL
ncbi:MAG: hypothetical protein KAG20_02080, partial [Cocleimonas sp.]|nr:hypothetical protein [Cocleimonas sp.]